MGLSSQIEKIPSRSEKRINAKEEIFEKASEKLSNYEELGSFYRGLNVEDAFLSLFGKLKLESDRTGGTIGQRDNATINSTDAIAYGRTSLTKDGKKFICAVGFDPVPGSHIESSKLGRWNQFRINGFIIAREVLVRFAGKKPGKPGRVQIFSPKSFYEWYKENVV